MDLLKLKTKKRMIGAAILLGAALFASNATAANDMAPGAGTVTVQDVNFDQILDIITTGGPGNILNVFLGNGDGTFSNVFAAGLGLGVEMGLVAAEDVPEITLYQNMMALHLGTTCCPEGGSGGGGTFGGFQIPGASSPCSGLPVELLSLMSAGGNC
ncbi:MAG: hypothetical protein GXP18_10200 [Gammaproteobacteria bacterium]|nr:hypothetical protein [Gammaproteobacteria bacterium]